MDNLLLAHRVAYLEDQVKEARERIEALEQGRDGPAEVSAALPCPACNRYPTETHGDDSVQYACDCGLATPRYRSRRGAVQCWNRLVRTAEQGFI